MSEKKTAAPKTVPSQPAALPVDPKYIGRIAGILLTICVVTALLLGIVNQITAPRIKAIQKAKMETAMRNVLTAEEYVPSQAKLIDHVESLYLAKSGGEDIGWVVETSTSGSQGAIGLMVGVDLDGKITGISVVSSSETPNIGTKVTGDQSVLDRFTGMSHEDGEITVNAGTNRFDGVSGATVSSRGVTAGVNAALDMVADLNAAQGGQ